MKIIDLLNKIANDGKIPERIKYNDYEYRYHDKEHGYCRSGYDCTYICLDNEYYLFDILNDEVEILEEEKKIPGKLDDFTIAVGSVDESNIEEYIQTLFNQQYEIFNKINSIIDYLKSKGK